MAFNGDSARRNYKTDGTIANVFGLTTGLGATDPNIVVNEYFNAASRDSEWVELLVLKDSLNMQGMKITDYTATGSNNTNPYTFSNHQLWGSVQKGTFIVVLGGNNPQTEDYDISDKTVIIRGSNSTYFLAGKTTFDIAGTADALEILSASGTHIHTLEHGNATWLSNLRNPKAIALGSSITGRAVRFKDVSSISDFSNSAKAIHDVTATQGAPNDAAETTFVNTVLPVELSSFIANINGNVILLEWNTATEINNYGFDVERRRVYETMNQRAHESTQLLNDSKSQWLKIGFVPGSGTSNAPRWYSFSDQIQSLGRYAYRLKQVDNDGTFKYSQNVEVEVIVPKIFALNQNYPNPFNPTTTIEYQIPPSHFFEKGERGGFVSLKVFDILGREIATLVNEYKAAGNYFIQWNAAHLPSGIYFYRLTAGQFSQVRKMTLIK